MFCKHAMKYLLETKLSTANGVNLQKYMNIEIQTGTRCIANEPFTLTLMY